MIDAATSLPGTRVVRVLDELAEARGLPETIVIDNGPEFTSRALDEWAYAQSAAALHHARAADRERLRRELQRKVSRRVPQRALVSESRTKPVQISRAGGSTTTESARIAQLGDLTPEEFAAKNVIGGSTNSQQTYPGLPQSPV